MLKKKGSSFSAIKCHLKNFSAIIVYIIGINIIGGFCQLQNQYVGCFYKKNQSSSDLQRDVMSDLNTMTIEKCVEKCRKEPPPLTYANLKNGTICHCANDYGVQVPDNICSTTCSGNETQYCGGIYKGLLANVVYAVCPIGYYGNQCGRACHCRRQVSCDRMSGKCPDGCHGNYTGASCDSINLSEQYIGCYKDNSSDRAIGRLKTADFYQNQNQNTIRRCTDWCANRSLSYAGAQFGLECFCGESFDKHGELKKERCNITCSGNGNETCGAASANSVYSVCPVGHFGRQCIDVCNCENKTRCVYRNGSCSSSQCKPGWTGHNCNVRDCNENNGDCYSNETCSSVDLKFSNVTLCRCTVGFQRSKIWKNCSDVNEGTSSMVGSVIGVIIILLIIVVAMALLYFMYRRKKINNTPSMHIEYPKSTSPRGSEDKPYEECNTAIYEQVIYVKSSTVATPVNMKDLQRVLRSKLMTSGLLEKEFKRVPMETKEKCNVGKHRDLKKKNRFKNIIPYDYNRVVLTELCGDPLSDYINASYVTGHKESDKFIATQGPRPETLDDFWRMIVEKNVNLIVMITVLKENQKVKCEKYWPDVGHKVTYGGITIETANERIWNDYVSRQIHVTNNSHSMTIDQWQFLTWPDHGVPCDANVFLIFTRKLRLSMSTENYVVVHCSAGVGRTGTFIAIDSLLEQGRAEGEVNIMGCLQRLRQQRCQMVQTLEQYEFIHKALLVDCTIGNTTMSCNRFSKTFQDLIQKDSLSDMSKLELQVRSLEETKHSLAGRKKSRATTKLIDKSRLVELDAVLVHGWKQTEVYMILKAPASSAAALNDFYTLCRVYNCTTVVFLDCEQNSGGSFIPTPENEIFLKSSTVFCESETRKAYGICYVITETKITEATYANTAQMDIYANAGGFAEKTRMTILHVTSVLNKDKMPYDCLSPLYKDLCQLWTTRGNKNPVFILSNSGYSLTGFCLASLIAFDMISEEREVDIYQTVQEIRKSREEFNFSLSSYKALHEVVGEHIHSSNSS